MTYYVYRYTWLIENVNDLLSMKASNVKMWLSFLADKGNSERSRNTRLTSVKEIYKYLKKFESIIDQAPDEEKEKTIAASPDNGDGKNGDTDE